MPRIRVPLVLGPSGLTPATPVQTQVPGSTQPIIPGKTHADGVFPGVLPGDPALNGLSVLVDVPDDDVTGGALDAQKVKARYPSHWLVANRVIPGT